MISCFHPLYDYQLFIPLASVAIWNNCKLMISDVVTQDVIQTSSDQPYTNPYKICLYALHKCKTVVLIPKDKLTCIGYNSLAFEAETRRWKGHAFEIQTYMVTHVHFKPFSVCICNPLSNNCPLWSFADISHSRPERWWIMHQPSVSPFELAVWKGDKNISEILLHGQGLISITVELQAVL